MTEALAPAVTQPAAGSAVPPGDGADPIIINPAPHQMSELAFFLGEYRGLTSDVPDEGPLKVITKTASILDGNWYQMQMVMPTNTETGTVVGWWNFGWDSVALQYVAQWYDNLGSYGTATSPGWVDGHLRFTGEYTRVIIAGGTSGVSEGQVIKSIDDFSFVAPGHLRDDITYLVDGKWEPCGVIDLHKVEAAG
ncbi:hypothetical protein ACFFX1_23470 [Dactylosporangium sucinum]|uniref:DUF1579 domain-containing protein n=1 Tax=Dactylosporangium sucinum TaxID=1424081 RepID=A0A917U9Z5_9ACTN|nr:hypothetical protein [Dactylosporangium sucinum]GGM70973.1 hypothetical protein GCM10007977_086070 [Dactylosporangium sucinum]